MSTQTYPGQFFFTAMSHRFYDVFVYKFVSPFLWGVKANEIISRYRQNIGERHLEVGVGTGYLLEHAFSDVRPAHLMLMDLNQECLDKSAVKLKSYQPDIRRQDVLVPFDLGESELTRFDSISMNYVLHCVPGDFKTKHAVFQHVKEVLADKGVFYGMTLLSNGVKRNLAARLLMRLLNQLGIFHNHKDNLQDFSNGLKKHFPNAEITVTGAAVLWRVEK